MELELINRVFQFISINCGDRIDKPGLSVDKPGLSVINPVYQHVTHLAYSSHTITMDPCKSCPEAILLTKI